MALTVMFALIASLVLTLTLMPVLASFLLRGRVAEKESRLIVWVRRASSPLLTRTTRHPGWTLGLAVLLLLGSGILASQLGGEFIPRLDEGALTVTTTKLPSIGLSSAVKTQTMIEQTLLKFPEVKTAVTLGGSSEIPTDPMGVEQSDTFIMLKPRSEWRTAQDREGLISAYSAALKDSVPACSSAGRSRSRCGWTTCCK